MLDLHPEVAAALSEGRPVVALESTLISHGLPWPANLETAREAEAAVRAAGAVPATVAVWEGVPTIGLTAAQLEALARRPDVAKATTRDLGVLIAQGRTGATTVAATMVLARRARIPVFATGGIGGVHRGAAQTFDVSADLAELARTPVAVVCAGAKAILDLALTLEVLETQGVPVLGYGTDDLPAFYVAASGLRLAARADTPAAVAAVLRAHWDLGGTGVVVAQPPPAGLALAPAEFAAALAQAEADVAAQGVRGPAVTPFLLRRLAELTGGRTLGLNRALVVHNAALAARVAAALFPPLAGRGA